jgi:hypothetical protein
MKKPKSGVWLDGILGGALWACACAAMAWTLDGASLGVGMAQQRWHEHTGTLPVTESGQGPVLMWSLQGQAGTVAGATLRWQLSGQGQQWGSDYTGFKQYPDGSIQPWQQTNDWRSAQLMAQMDAAWPIRAGWQWVLTGAVQAQQQWRDLHQYREHMRQQNALWGVGLHWQATPQWRWQVQALEPLSGASSARLSAPSLGFDADITARPSFQTLELAWQPEVDPNKPRSEWVLRWQQRRTQWGASTQVNGHVFPGAHQQQRVLMLGWGMHW